MHNRIWIGLIGYGAALGPDSTLQAVCICGPLSSGGGAASDSGRQLTVVPAPPACQAPDLGRSSELMYLLSGHLFFSRNVLMDHLTWYFWTLGISNTLV